jgi:hypothetical protein
MTTKLHKSIARVSNEHIRDTGKFRPLVVTLYPSGCIGLRPQGTRREELYPLANIYAIAVKARVAAEKAEKKAARKTIRS